MHITDKLVPYTLIFLLLILVGCGGNNDSSAPLVDMDNDGISDVQDNCPEINNPDQQDDDNDGVGNACEEASAEDSDGSQDIENCEAGANGDQVDSDNDGIIDICDNSPNGEIGQCNDGIDNDGDGLVDWQYDVGCYGADDATEAAGSRVAENGWTTFDLSPDSQVIYVSSSDGDDTNDGLTPETAKATPEAGFALIRDGYPDFLLLKRGDTWRDTTLTRRDLENGVGRVPFKSGRSENEKFVISTYGYSQVRPRLEIETHFINDHGRAYKHFAVQGLALISYKKEPNTPDFDGATGGGIRFVGDARSADILLEDLYVQYGELVSQSVDDIEIRRNVVYRSYHVGTCAFDADGNRLGNGDPGFRPSGMFMGETNGALLEDNIWDQNGWNPDIPVGPDGACATQYNHNVYLADVRDVTVKNDVFLRASSIGLKVSGNKSDGINNLNVRDNFFAEGEIGISMAGNSSAPYTHVNSIVDGNVFSDIGKSKPATRTLSWGIWIQNHDNSVFSNNLFANILTEGNQNLMIVEGDTNRNVVIENNLAYAYPGRALKITEANGWDSVVINNNTFHSNNSVTQMVYHRGDFSGVNYSSNAYYSNFTDANPNRDGWFDNVYPMLDFEGWRSRSGENDAVLSTYEAFDAGRNIDSYASSINVGSSIDDFALEARKQSRFNYRNAYEAKAINTYFREGYPLP